MVGNLYILHLGAAFGGARLEGSSPVWGFWAQSEQEEVEEHRMHDGHCWHIAAVEVVDLTHGGPAMAGKVEEGMTVAEESQESLDLVEEGKKIGLVSVSEAR